jgi:hypothetical protein
MHISLKPHSPTRVAALVSAALLAALPANSQTVDTTLVAAGLSQPVYATAPLADGRVFIVEKGGAIRVSQDGVLSTFLTVPVATSGEQGLLGLAFDPGYANPASAGYRRFFVNTIEPSTLDTVVLSYRTSAGNASVADATSRTEIIRLDQPNGLNNHKAGWLGFEPGDNNNLYISTGDGGGGSSQDMSGALELTAQLNLETAVNRFPPRETYLFSSTCGHTRLHLLGEIATHPIEPRWAAWAALLLLAGIEPAASSRLAQTAHRGPLGRV